MLPRGLRHCRPVPRGPLGPATPALAASLPRDHNPAHVPQPPLADPRRDVAAAARARRGGAGAGWRRRPRAVGHATGAAPGDRRQPRVPGARRHRRRAPAAGAGDVPELRRVLARQPAPGAPGRAADPAPRGLADAPQPRRRTRARPRRRAGVAAPRGRRDVCRLPGGPRLSGDDTGRSHRSRAVRPAAPAPRTRRPHPAPARRGHPGLSRPAARRGAGDRRRPRRRRSRRRGRVLRG